MGYAAQNVFAIIFLVRVFSAPERAKPERARVAEHCERSFPNYKVESQRGQRRAVPPPRFAKHSAPSLIPPGPLFGLPKPWPETLPPGKIARTLLGTAQYVKHGFPRQPRGA